MLSRPALLQMELALKLALKLALLVAEKIRLLVSAMKSRNLLGHLAANRQSFSLINPQRHSRIRLLPSILSRRRHFPPCSALGLLLQPVLLRNPRPQPPIHLGVSPRHSPQRSLRSLIEIPVYLPLLVLSNPNLHFNHHSTPFSLSTSMMGLRLRHPRHLSSIYLASPSRLQLLPQLFQHLLLRLLSSSFLAFPLRLLHRLSLRLLSLNFPAFPRRPLPLHFPALRRPRMQMTMLA